MALGPLTEVVGYHLAQASVVATVDFERHVGGPFALRKVEFSLLMLLLANGATPPKRLAQALMLAPPALTLLLDRLQERQLLRRQQNPADGRSQHVVLTAAGQRLARECAAAAVGMEQELGSRLSPAERAILIELLGKIVGRKPLR